MKPVLTKFLDVLRKLEHFIVEFNSQHSNPTNEIVLGLKGSYVLVEKGILNKTVNDLDFFLLNRHYSHNRFFVQSLIKKFDAHIIKQDDNLIIIQIDQINLEFILFERIEWCFVEKYESFQFIRFLKSDFAVFQKICAISYIGSKYFPHDKVKKLDEYLIFIHDICNNGYYAKIANNLLLFDHFCKQQMFNSFFIYKYYQYTDNLEFQLDLNDPVLSLPKYQIIMDQVGALFTKLLAQNDGKLRLLWQITQKLLLYASQIRDWILDGAITPSLPGFEKTLIEQLFTDYQPINNSAFLIVNDVTKPLFLAHADEVGGLCFNHQIHNQGTINWVDGGYCFYDASGKLVHQATCTKIDHQVFSSEKMRKINRPTLALAQSGNNLSPNQVYQVVSDQLPAINEVVCQGRNWDNRINVLLFSCWQRMGERLNFCVTTQEEIGLRGIKDQAVIDQIMQFGTVVNFEVSEFDQWEQEGLLVRVADPFTAINLTSLQRLQTVLDDFKIPYQLYFGSGSTDAMVLHAPDAITIALGANQIHGTSSTIFTKNIFYALSLMAILQQ